MVTAVPTIVTFPESKLTLDQKIEKWTWEYCRALEENYRLYSMRHCERNMKDCSFESPLIYEGQINAKNKYNAQFSIIKFSEI